MSYSVVDAFFGCPQSRFWDLSIMPDESYLSCLKSCPTLSVWVGFVTKDPHHRLYKISNWKYALQVRHTAPSLGCPVFF